MEILRCIAPVCGTIVVVVTIIEETAVGSVACPADNASCALCCPQVALGTIAAQGVVSNGHIGRVV